MATVSINPPDAQTGTEESSPGHPSCVPYRLSADDYFRMVDADIIPSERRVWLWEGQLYEKMAKKLPHAVGQNMLFAALMKAWPEGWSPWSESPILVNDFSAPLPDFALVRGALRHYEARGSVPRADEVGLVVEVADSSLRKNLTKTLQTYALAGLPVYWVINLVAKRVEVYSQPGVVEGGLAGYASAQMFEIGQDVPLVLDGREVARIPAADLLPGEPGPAAP